MGVLDEGEKKPEKLVVWHGDSKEEIQKLSPEVRRAFGYDLDSLQNHDEPIDWKPFAGLGKPAFELRTKDATGAYRAIYVTFVKNEIHVLHVFKKDSQKTALKDVRKAKERLKKLLSDLERK